ncbi:hypothetical protein PO027_19635 [Bacteroides thetaiotaomicron]|uniref:hypothetical protein n=1 Tax=Bacteroides thetaiotaomicron TaxID=818 RepID=UPI00232D9DE8|nr:hypothetical protein [Bacteroides thetaiotaomicron]MDC2009075.1 hypothetical protein [Bacteroides thetaiotaomicron]MDC2023207.1 hypothetical protein [Bacteroides thetaiotaomicron]MDC2025819.1 hypothetical protein [Bacteroides thetaiotaomicron]MDC2032329.1 hypothetical protein [Bacteroides thetaiotaomicron]MDC2063292.1 hypothetical protein [Bacteroides thetaiotaomicron]
MKEVVYEVWGEDTFAREEYLVGVYDTQEEANKILRESEQSALQTCEELRDTYWICELTPERKQEREEREARREERRRKRSDFNYIHLCEIVSRLNKRLLDTVARDKKGLIADKEIKLTEKNEETNDCYSSLSLQYIRGVKSKSGCLVYIEIEFKDEGMASSSSFVGTPDRIRRQFSYKKGEKFVTEIVDRMIVEFFR